MVADLMAKAGQAIGGLLFGNYEDRRQVKQQGKLQKQQIEGQKELGKFNQSLALDTWEKTNYEAQRKQLEKAGLNAGLMYGSAGAGGTTAGGSAGSVTGASAAGSKGEIGLGLQLGMQAEMQKAQIELVKAQTQNTQADTAKKSGVETREGETRIEQIKAQTNNENVRNNILKYEEAIQKVEMEIKQGTKENSIESIRLANDIAEQQIKAMKNTNEITDETKEELIKQIRTNSLEQGLRIEAQKKGLIRADADTKAVNKGIEKMSAEIGKMSNDVLNNWRQLDQHQQEIEIKKILMNLQQTETEFRTSTPQEIRQWTGILTDLIPFAGQKK